MIPAVVRRLHAEYLPHVKIVQDHVRDSVLTYCEARGFAYAGRIKEERSLAEKLESGRYGNWASIDDFFACTIIIPSLTFEDQVIDFLTRTFKTASISKRGETRKPPDQFRFDATRFRGYLVPMGAAEKFNDVQFEVQIRSAFEHAWSVATHSLTYKGKVADWRALRLSAQLKAAVEQLDTLIMRFEEAAVPIVEHQWMETELKSSIENVFLTYAESGKLPEESRPKDWGRFTENVFSLIRSSSAYPYGKEHSFIDDCMAALSSEIDGCHERNTFPRSLSLLQFCAGTLATSGLLRGGLRRYTLLVTDELLDIYPATARITPVFQWPSPSELVRSPTENGQR